MSETAERSLSKLESQIERMIERVEGMKETIDGLRASLDKSLENHGDLKTDQGRIDERLRHVEREIGDLKREATKNEKARDDKEGLRDERLRAIERKMWAWGGGLAVLFALLELVFKH